MYHQTICKLATFKQYIHGIIMMKIIPNHKFSTKRTYKTQTNININECVLSKTYDLE